MALESGVNYIEDLVSTNPESTDAVAEGDDHIRNIKTAVQGSFPNLGAAAVTKTAAEINDLVEQTDPVLNGGLSGTAFLDEDDMFSNSQYAAASQQSIKAYVDTKRTLVSPPEVFTPAGTINAWQTINIVTLGTVGALSATIRISINTGAGNSVTSRTLNVYARKTGSGLGLTAATQVIFVQDFKETAIQFTGRGAAEFTVELDGNGDFDLYIETNDTSLSTASGALVVYYV